MKDSRQPAYLIVNADDYAYFPGISRGILEAHRQGVVTATGVLANGSSFEEDVSVLAAEIRIDAGVHLNVTHGTPLTAEMRRCLPKGLCEFPGKGWFARSLLTGRIRTDDVADEWRAQIDRCLEKGLTLRFLNSHEHIHMIPPLFELIKTLAADYGIPFIRFPHSRIPRRPKTADIVRCATLRVFSTLNRRHLVMPSIRLLGTEYSGRLSQSRVYEILNGVKAGQIYELMCHPGYGTGSESASARVRGYHRWDVELACLISPEIRALCNEKNIKLVGYRDLDGLMVAA